METRRAMDRLNAANQFLSKVMATATNGILVLDREGAIVHANQAMASMTGTPGDELSAMAETFEAGATHGDVVSQIETST